MSSNTEVNKVDMSLDDIIKLNRKEKKKNASQKKTGQPRKAVAAMGRVKQFRSKFNKAPGNTLKGQTQLGQRKRPNKGRGPMNTVAQRALQTARKTLAQKTAQQRNNRARQNIQREQQQTKQNIQQAQRQARQNVQMKRRGLQTQPVNQNRRFKLNRGFRRQQIQQQHQQLQQQQQQPRNRRQWKNKAGRANNQNILTVSINNNRLQQNQVKRSGQYPRQDIQQRNNQQRRQRKNNNRQQNVKQIIQHLQSSAGRKHRLNSGNMSVNQTGRTLSDRFGGGNQGNQGGQRGGRKGNRQRGGRGGFGRGGGNNVIQNTQQGRGYGNQNKQRRRRGGANRGGGAGGNDRMVFW